MAAFGKLLKIEYPLLTNGNRLALRHFFVPDYPANYWVDRNGKVVDFEYGFDAEKTPKRLRKVTRALLSK